MRLRDYPFKIFYSTPDDPLHNFYIPALSASVHYDRLSGFFSSYALAMAAAGVARLIQNQGTMWLLVGAQLDPNDVEAVKAGHDLKPILEQRLLEAFQDPADLLVADRLKALAWMIADGTLEIKVVVPTDSFGRRIPAETAAPYFHPKAGLFADAYEDRVGFNGSPAILTKCPVLAEQSLAGRGH